MSKMEMVYFTADGLCLKTGIGASMETSADTLTAFRAAKKMEAPYCTAEFLLDFYDDDEDLVDTIPLSRNGFEQISGEKALTEAEYLKIEMG